MRFRTYSAFTVAAVAVALTASMTTASAAPPGFRTKQPSMLTPVMEDVEILPILTVGDDLAGGYQFEAIPDGISVRPKLNGRAEILVNHETSKVPFPYNPSVAVTDPTESQNDFDNAQVSRLTLNAGGRVMSASFAIDSAEGFQRFCSNFLATISEGFDKDILFTNEESPDYVLRQEASWPVAIDDPNEKEAGLVVAYDVDADTHRTIPGMGRHNHENAVAIPGYDDLVVLSGDDTFTSGPLTDPTVVPPTTPPTTLVPAQSELYSYIAPDTDSLLDDEGQLWAFVSDNPAVDDYYDFTPTNSATLSVSGHFITVPRNIATGLNPDGSEMTSADVPAAQGGPFPPPPADGSWQRDLRSSTPLGIDGPQWVLQYWATQHNVFEFVRVEDIAYDKRPGMENVVYIIDSGRGRRATDPLDTPFRSTNGRVWKMVLDPADHTHVDSLSVLVEGDDNPVQTLGEIHQPDNLESTPNGLLVTEDPGSSQQFPAGSTLPNATTARLWWVPFAGSPEVVAKVNQSADEGPTDVDPPDTPPLAPAAFLISPGNLGAWESSGIVDASEAFGPGAFLIDVQAHTLWVEKATGIDTPFDDNSDPDFTFKREGGQLLLIRVPATVAE